VGNLPRTRRTTPAETVFADGLTDRSPLPKPPKITSERTRAGCPPAGRSCGCWPPVSCGPAQPKKISQDVDATWERGGR